MELQRRRTAAPARAGLGLLATCILLGAGTACRGDQEREGDVEPAAERGPLAERDLTQIQASDTLVVLTPYNSTSYFIYRGEAMGFEYDLLQAFARARDLVLRVRVVQDPDSLYRLLESGQGDVVAGRVLASPRTDWRVAYTRQLYETPPTLVQRTGAPDSLNLPEAADTMVEPPDGAAGADPGAVRPETEPVDGVPGDEDRVDSIRVRLLTRPGQLAGDTVHLPWRSPYRWLVELEDAVSGDVVVVEMVDSASHEALIRRVAHADIDLTIAPENLAKLTESQFANLGVLPRVGPPQPVVWAVRENAPALGAALDGWIAEAEREGRLGELYQRYFVDRRGYQERVVSEYLASRTGQLSRFDSLFQQYAPELGWDWRLLASQSYQESRFVPTARSWAGAVGLLQLMPATARSVGVRNPRDPEQNVAGAVRFLEDLVSYWERHIPDEQERLRFVLASYNVGIGHVQDARRLTTKHGGDPNAWDEVAYWLLQKSRKEVYTDPVVKYGFARGVEPVTYVALVLERFEHYRQFVVS